jgi:signal transduction histidine kinase
LKRLIRIALENGIDEKVGEFDGQRMRTLNAGVLMISLVAVLSMPVMAFVGRAETIPGTALFLVLMGLVAWLQTKRRPREAALALTLVGMTVLGLQSYSLERDFGVHFWLLALILFPLLFFPKSSTRTAPVLGTLVTLGFAAFSIREQQAAGYTDESLATQILAASVILGLSITMRLQVVRAERAYDDHNRQLEQQAEKLRDHQEQLEMALAEADEARAVLDRRVEERTLDLREAHDRLSLELGERSRADEERRALQAELHHAQRMESVGQLAGGVAHDFNNLLTVIGGNIDLALTARGSMTENQRSWLGEAQAATERAATVTGQLLAYSRKQAVVLETVQPAKVIQSMRRMIERAAGEQIRVEIETAELIGMVRVGKGQLEQVLMNLALNACDAMPSGGRLRIEASQVEQAPRIGGSTDAVDRPHLAVHVRDTGIGMAESTRSRVFDPFFTTKEAGKGTGLGLSVTHGIVTGHEGRVDVRSEPGEGATFSFYLPVVEDLIVDSSPPVGFVPEVVTAGETILVVEDEAAVRRFTSALLERRGYHVLVAASGEEALRLAENHQGKIDLLLTDVVMPGLQGPELASALLEMRPDTCVLYVSGYADPERLLQLELDESRAFLQKPFSVDRLSRQVRDLLEHSAS